MLNSLFIFSEVHYAIQQNRGINAKNRRISSISNFKRYQKFRKVHFHVGRKEKAIPSLKNIKILSEYFGVPIGYFY